MWKTHSLIYITLEDNTMKYIEDIKALTKSFYLKNSFEKIDKDVYKFLLQFSKKIINAM